MIYCLQAELSFDSAARRDQVITEINARLGTKQKWGTAVVAPADRETGEPSVTVEARLVVEADLTEVVAALEGYLVGPRLPLPGSWYTLHDCTHDEAGSACVTETTRTW